MCTQIWATLYDYPGLKSCDGLIKYIKECVRTAWGLTNQVKLCLPTANFNHQGWNWFSEGRLFFLVYALICIIPHWWIKRSRQQCVIAFYVQAGKKGRAGSCLIIWLLYRATLIYHSIQYPVHCLETFFLTKLLWKPANKRANAYSFRSLRTALNMRPEITGRTFMWDSTAPTPHVTILTPICGLRFWRVPPDHVFRRGLWSHNYQLDAFMAPPTRLIINDQTLVVALHYMLWKIFNLFLVWSTSWWGWLLGSELWCSK